MRSTVGVIDPALASSSANSALSYATTLRFGIDGDRQIPKHMLELHGGHAARLDHADQAGAVPGPDRNAAGQRPCEGLFHPGKVHLVGQPAKPAFSAPHQDEHSGRVDQAQRAKNNRT